MFSHLKKHTALYFLPLIALVSLAQADQTNNISEEQIKQLTESLIIQPKIVVSIKPLYEIVSSLSHNIAKPEVIYLHINETQMALSDIQRNKIQQADIIIRLGRGYEPVLDKFLEQQGSILKNKTITLSNYIPLLDKTNLQTNNDNNIIFTDRQAYSDMRFWMDPRLVKILVGFITPRLVFMDPIHQEEYLDNEIIVKSQLKKVEKKVLGIFNQLSLEQKLLMAQFNPYLKNRYTSFAELNGIDIHNNINKSSALCMEKYSFDTIPLNLYDTENAIYTFLNNLQLCTKSNMSFRKNNIFSQDVNL